MIKIAICDDTLEELQHTQTLISDFLEKNAQKNAKIFPFRSPGRMLEQARRERFHIYVLDVIMEEKNGIETGEAIRRLDSEASIIYQSVSPDFAVESYAVRAYYYLLKPVGEETLFPVLSEIFEHLRGKASRPLLVKTRDGLEPVDTGDILFVEYHSHRLSYHMTQRRLLHSITYRKPFDDLSEPLLEDGRFVKISSSFLVNMTYIQKITKKGFLMKDGTELIVTRLYSEAKKDYMDFLIKGSQ